MATQLRHLRFVAAGLQYTGRYSLRTITITNRAIGAGTCQISDGTVAGGTFFIDVEVPAGDTRVIEFTPDDFAGIVGVFVDTLDATMAVVMFGKGWSTG